MAGKGGKQPGAGRPKGSKNKQGVAVKDMLVQALDEVGGKDYMVGLAQTEPKSFATLVGKLIPNEVAAQVDGDIRIEIVDFKDNPASE